MQTPKNKEFPLKDSVARLSLQLGVILAIILIGFMVLKQTIYVGVYSEDMSGVSDGNNFTGTRQAQVLQANKSLPFASPTQNIIVTPQINTEILLDNTVGMVEFPTPTPTSVPTITEPAEVSETPTAELNDISITLTTEPTATSVLLCSGTISSSPYSGTMSGNNGECTIFTDLIITKAYYVDSTGNDSNPGTQSQPWKTIQKASDTMIAGDIVVVQAGDYAAQRVNVTRSGSSGASITYLANGNVIMKGFNVQANYITIRGFEIANTDYRRWDREKSAGVNIHGSNNVVENNYIHDSSLDGIYIYGPPSEPTASNNNIIRNNKLFHNELAGIEVNGRNNLIERNDVWGTVQCHPTLMAFEDFSSDNPNHLKCPNYPAISSLDADGIRFFGQGHIFRKNSIHDILLGSPGINPAIGDYNVSPHIDCFQTWSSYDNEVAKNIIFEQNYCENLTKGMEAFMLEGGTNNLIIRNNIIKAFKGVVTGQTGQHHLYIYNNLWINDLSLVDPDQIAIDLDNAPYSQVENNIFYNQPTLTIVARVTTSGQVINYNMAFNNDGSKAACSMVGNYVCANPPPDHDLWNIDPRFTNPDIFDYHLQPDSPAIDKGVAVPVTNDYDGNPRPHGGGFEIGPLEYY